MKGDFNIDGVSAYSTYGVFVAEHGLADIISLPSFKALEAVDWLDENGIDVDLSAPVLDKRTLNITFGFKSIGSLPQFFKDLADAHSHTFSFKDISHTLTLRMTSSGSISSLIEAGKITLSFVQDVVPLTNRSPYALGLTRVTQRGFKLDDIDLSRYGCWVLDGTIQDWRRSPAVKENLTIASKVVAGQTYYGQTGGVRYKSKDITLNLLINARDKAEFNRCYRALIYKLTRSEEHSLKLGIYSGENPCYYKSLRCSRLEFCKSGTIWCQFSLTLTMLRLGTEGEIGLLAAENGYYVITEDGKFIHITTI